MSIKNELIKKITNEDLKLAVAEAHDSVKKDNNWIPNPLFPELLKGIGRVQSKVESLNEYGLFYKNKDIYI